MKLKSPFLVAPHTKVKLAHLSTTAHHQAAKEHAATAVVEKRLEQLSALQEVLYASQSHSVLIVLQGMDTAGKDGTIRHIFSGINPQGCAVSSFKVPTPLEAAHDPLWRCQKRLPARGMIGIFNRSHYEEVLSPVVHGGRSGKAARRLMDQINGWEETLAANNTLILKFFLHISKEEQTARLQSRIDTPDKRWKLSPADFAERPFWPRYVDAYEEILRHTSHKHAPWFVIPADHKWFRNFAISGILVDALKGLKIQYPKPTFDAEGLDLAKMDAADAARVVAKRAKAEKA